MPVNGSRKVQPSSTPDALSFFEYALSLCGNSGCLMPVRTRVKSLLGKINRSAAVVLAIAIALCSPLLSAQTFTVLHSFTGADGASPDGGLSLDAVGTLYGTTSSGGSHNLGTIFKLKTTGTETVLHSFSGYASDGFGPLYVVARKYRWLAIFQWLSRVCQSRSSQSYRVHGT